MSTTAIVILVVVGIAVVVLMLSMSRGSSTAGGWFGSGAEASSTSGIINSISSGVVGIGNAAAGWFGAGTGPTTTQTPAEMAAVTGDVVAGAAA